MKDVIDGSSLLLAELEDALHGSDVTNHVVLVGQQVKHGRTQKSQRDFCIAAMVVLLRGQFLKFKVIDLLKRQLLGHNSTL